MPERKEEDPPPLVVDGAVVSQKVLEGTGHHVTSMVDGNDASSREEPVVMNCNIENDKLDRLKSEMPPVQLEKFDTWEHDIARTLDQGQRSYWDLTEGERRAMGNAQNWKKMDLARKSWGGEDRDDLARALRTEFGLVKVREDDWVEIMYEKNLVKDGLAGAAGEGCVLPGKAREIFRSTKDGNGDEAYQVLQDVIAEHFPPGRPKHESPKRSEQVKKHPEGPLIPYDGKNLNYNKWEAAVIEMLQTTRRMKRPDDPMDDSDDDMTEDEKAMAELRKDMMSDEELREANLRRKRFWDLKPEEKSLLEEELFWTKKRECFMHGSVAALTGFAKAKKAMKKGAGDEEEYKDKEPKKKIPGREAEEEDSDDDEEDDEEEGDETFYCWGSHQKDEFVSKLLKELAFVKRKQDRWLAELHADGHLVRRNSRGSRGYARAPPFTETAVRDALICTKKGDLEEAGKILEMRWQDEQR